MKSFKEKSLIRIKPSIRSAPSSNPSEFHWPNAEDGKNSSNSGAVSELISALKDTPSANVQSRLGNLKKNISTAYNRQPKPLRAPLHDRERERLERDAAYRETKKEISDWDEI